MKNLKEFNLSNYSVTKDGKIYSSYSSRFLKPSISQDGYYKVILIDDQKKRKDFRVHRLVGMAFCEGYVENLVINHKDGNKLNNHYSNLEWCTISYNTRHAIENKLQGSAGGKNLLPVEKVHSICRLLEQGYRKKDIAEVLAVTVRHVTEIQNKTFWSWISDEYNINYIKKSSKLSLEKVLFICEKLEQGITPKVIAEECGTHWSSIYRIRNRQIYSDISKNFHW